MKRYVLAIAIAALLTSLFAVSEAEAIGYGSLPEIRGHATDGIVSDVPYVWQEIDGLCAWAATSMAVQAAGVDLDLYDILASSVVGFSFSYLHYNSSILMFPGPMDLQVEATDFLCDLNGLNMTAFFDVGLDVADELYDLWTSRGINTQLLNGEQGAFALMHHAIDSGYPLLISVDPLWLPAEDYNPLRALGIEGAGHGILIVGYNDTGGYATIMDPGVGTFGDYYGYPVDGRGEYAEISYTALNNAWFKRSYMSILITPGDSALVDRSADLGKSIRDKLLGDPSAYYADVNMAILMDFGEGAFRQISEDFSPEGIADYFDIFTGMAGEREFKTHVLEIFGIGLQKQTTLQYLSYRKALESLPSLMSDVNLAQFIGNATLALPHFESLANNSTSIYLVNTTKYEGFVYETFHNISILYNSTGDLAAALELMQTNLNEITDHFEAIADSWLRSGEALAIIWPRGGITDYVPLVVVGALGVGALFVLVILYIRRLPSQ